MDDKTFRARFCGRCAKCGGTVNVGDTIKWNRAQRGVVWHANCNGVATPQPEPPAPRDERDASNKILDNMIDAVGTRSDGTLGADEVWWHGDPPPTARTYSDAVEAGHAISDADVDGMRDDATVSASDGDGDGAPPAASSATDNLAKVVAEAVRPYLEKRLTAKADDSKLAAVAKAASEADKALAVELADVRKLAESVASGEPDTGSLTITVKRPDETEYDIDSAHKELPRLLYLLSKRLHVYLWGPPGGGKSHAAKQAAQALNLEYGYISLNPQTPESRLLGFTDATGIYRDTPFYRAYKEGGVFCIDELDNAHPALLNTLNGLLENGLAAFPCGMVERHPNFVLVGTGNTNGRGGNVLYPERRALDSAFAERFVFLAWGYDTRLETALVKQANPNAMAWLKWCRALRKHVLAENVRVHVTPRASVRGARLIADSGWTLDEIAEATVFKGVGEDTVTRLLERHPLPTLAYTDPSWACFWQVVSQVAEATELASE